MTELRPMQHVRATSDRRLAFTLLEMLVVMMILAILAGLAVPRMLGNDARVFRVTCEQVADLLTMYAKRESTGSKPVGLMYDEDRRWLAVVEFDAEMDARGTRSRAGWQYDALIQPVKLPPFVELTDVRSNGDYANISQWPLSSRPGQQRPSISLALEGPEGSVTFILPPYAVSPRQIGGVDASPYYPVPVDLNAMGQSRGEW